jgi:hypothetical protein
MSDPQPMEANMIIPDYLIIDEIRRREERSWEPETLQLPLPAYDIPDEKQNYPNRQTPKKPEKPIKNNGVIIIDMNTYRRIV